MTMRPSTAPGRIMSSPLTLMEERRREIPRLPPVPLLLSNANEAGEGRCQGCPTWPLRQTSNRPKWRFREACSRSSYGRLLICDENPLRRRLRETMARPKRPERCVRMARKMTEWPSKREPLTEIRPSDGCKGDAVPSAVVKWNDFHEFGRYLWNLR